MITIHCFTFNPLQENTYILYDTSGECLIIDPGCYSPKEQEELTTFVTKKSLTPVRLINTHCHIDHILGNHYIAEKYGLKLEIHKIEHPILSAAKEYAYLYDLNYKESPAPGHYLIEGEMIEFGSSKLSTLFVPGHSPGHLAFVNKEQRFVIGGDVLFQGSIGRTDLPGGDYPRLIDSIKTKLIPLGDDYQIYAGHGPSTNVAFEKANNPFL